MPILKLIISIKNCDVSFQIGLKLDFVLPLKPNGAPGRIRTVGPLLRRQLLYPPELQARLPHPHLWKGKTKVLNGRGGEI
jgi:hypothetical protein